MLDGVFHAVANSAGIPPDYVRLVACLLIAYGLSPILPLLPSASLRHLMNIAVSLFFLVGILHLNYGTANLVASTLVIYGIVYFRIGGKRMPWVAFVVEMAHMLSTYVASTDLVISLDS